MEDQTFEDYYYTKKSERPPENQHYNQYVCESFKFATLCSFIYSGYNSDSNSLNNKIVFKFIKRIRGKEDRLENEIQIMNELNHQYILKPLFSFPYRQYLCIITKLAHHGTLFDVVSKYRSGIGEDLARIAMRQMLEALQYLHSNRIWHRDIKPQNYFVYSWAPDPIYIEMADFGFAKMFNEDELGNEFIGTYDYAAPEIYRHRPYTNSVDIWSLGVTLFFMLTNQNPFPKHETFPTESAEKIMEGRLNMSILQNNKSSIDVIDLIDQMCRLDPKERITAEEALNHSWFRVPQKLTPVESQTSRIIFSGDIAD